MKKSIILIGLVITAALMLHCHLDSWAQPPSSNLKKPIPAALRQKIIQFRNLMDEKKAEGANVSEGMKLDRKSRNAARAGKFEEAIRLIDEAIAAVKVSTVAKTRNSADMFKPEAATEQRTGNYKTIDLNVTSAEVTVTKAVPDFKYGKEVWEAKNPFPFNVVKAVGGEVKIDISSMPVFVEEGFVAGGRKQVSTPGASLNSPFGGSPGEVPNFDRQYADIGVKWIRYSGKSMAWGIVERTKGVYDWSLCDGLFSETSKNGIHSFITVRSFNPWDQTTQKMEKGKFLKPKAPTDMANFLKFLAKAVERYDGDGVDDAPGSPVVNYWQIENEVDGNFWGDTPESYAKLLKAAYQTIKKANPRAKVVIAGASTVEGFDRFYVPVLKELQNIADKRGDRYFDIFDLHWYGNVGEYKKIMRRDLQSFMDNYNKTLSNCGYSNTPLWITETGTYGGKGVVGRGGEPLPEQDEAAQAAELVKRYVYFVGNGIKKVFWCHMVNAHHDNIGKPNDYFENVGLVNNPRNNGDSSNKLAYYSYKFLVDMLEGSDWETIRRIDLGSDVHAYRFLKNGKGIYVIWYDGTETI
jgi:hypothetical protein